MVNLNQARHTGCIVAIVVALLAGCGRNASSPVDNAHYLFSHSKFDEALQVCDQIVAVTKDPQELSDLHLLRGRCFLEQAARLRRSAADSAQGALPEATKAKLQQAVEAFSASIAAKDNANARYFRSETQETLGNEDAAREDGRIARIMDEEYQVSRINERVEQPPTSRSDTADAAQAEEAESAGGFGELASQAAASETESSQGSPRQSDEEGDAAASAAAESAGQVVVPGRESPLRPPVLGQQRSRLKSPANAYVGKPLPPGSTTFGGPPAQKDAARTMSGREKTRSGDTNRVTPATDKQSQEQGKKEGQSEGQKRDTSQGNKTPGETQDGRSTGEEGDESDIADDSSDAAPTDEESTDDQPAPRRPIAWPPINGPWSTFPAGPGAMPLPTTGLGTSPSWGATPPATATGWQAAPTTGIGAAPAWSGIGFRPGTTGAVGGVGNPFAPPTATAPGYWPLMPGTGSTAVRPNRIGPGATSGPGGPIGWPQRTFGGPVTPIPFAPPLPTQELPTTGVHRSVAPFPQ